MIAFIALMTLPVSGPAQPAASGVLFENVRVFDGVASRLSPPANVLVVGNKIEEVSTAPIAVPPNVQVRRLAGDGRTLMPGLIDAHTHVMFAIATTADTLTSDVGYINLLAAQWSRELIEMGYTSCRDMGGPVFGLKKGIDRGITVGPRIWPSGSFISQSGGHGDFRLPTDFPAPPGQFTHSERVWGSIIADSPDMVRMRTRELLALGASQIKLMAGGGVTSSYDPLDVTQYTVPEIRAAVEAAENWGTYVTVHAYTSRAIRQSIEAGVKCIEHGQLIDEPTMKLIGDKGIWLCLQPFTDEGEQRFPDGSPNRLKQLEMYNGTDTAYRLAKKYKVKLAWGIDSLLNPAGARRQSEFLGRMLQWFTSAEVLKMATHGNAQLLALSGPRNPYPGKLGVVQEGALADLILLRGDPIANIRLLEDKQNVVVVMKDGKIYKNLDE